MNDAALYGGFSHVDFDDVETPPEHLRSSMCGSKRGYGSNREARRIRKMHRLMYRDKLDIYRCPFCGLFHLGHKKPRVQE